MPNWTPTASESALVALGGGVGAFLRLSAGRGLAAAGLAHPWQTAAVNVVGSFALGLLIVACRGKPGALILLGTGLCGGFTTFSTFGVELARLLADGRTGLAGLYAMGSVFGAIAGAALGERVALAAAGG